MARSVSTLGLGVFIPNTLLHLSQKPLLKLPIVPPKGPGRHPDVGSTRGMFIPQVFMCAVFVCRILCVEFSCVELVWVEFLRVEFLRVEFPCAQLSHVIFSCVQLLCVEFLRVFFSWVEVPCAKLSCAKVLCVTFSCFEHLHDNTLHCTTQHYITYNLTSYYIML